MLRSLSQDDYEEVLIFADNLGIEDYYWQNGPTCSNKENDRDHDIAGDEKDIAVYLIANEDAIPFYEKIGMKLSDDVMQYNKIEWTNFTVE